MVTLRWLEEKSASAFKTHHCSWRRKIADAAGEASDIGWHEALAAAAGVAKLMVSCGEQAWQADVTAYQRSERAGEGRRHLRRAASGRIRRASWPKRASAANGRLAKVAAGRLAWRMASRQLAKANIWRIQGVECGILPQRRLAME